MERKIIQFFTSGAESQGKILKKFACGAESEGKKSKFSPTASKMKGNRQNFRQYLVKYTFVIDEGVMMCGSKGREGREGEREKAHPPVTKARPSSICTKKTLQEAGPKMCDPKPSANNTIRCLDSGLLVFSSNYELRLQP